MQIKEQAFELWEGLKDAAFEINTAKKRDFSLNVRVIVLNENQTVDSFDGLLLGNRLIAYIKKLNIVIIRPVIWNYKGVNTIFIPEGCHEGLDYKKIKGCTDAQQYEAYLQWPVKRSFVETKVATKGSINWNLFNNKYSPKFAFDSYLIIDTKVLDQIRDIPNLKLLLLMLSAALAGFILGGTASLGIYVIILMLT